MVQKREDYELAYEQAKNAPPKEIDCELVSYVTCPWCGKEDYDPWEYDQSDGDVEEIECGYCEKTFWVQCMITVKYTSKKEPWK